MDTALWKCREIPGRLAAPVPVYAWHVGGQLLSVGKGIALLIYELIIIIIAFVVY